MSMREVDFPPGTHIARAAVLLCNAAAEDGEAKGNFNGIILQAGRDSEPASIIAAFEAATEAAAKAYRESPAGIAAEERRQETRRQTQAAHDALMARLSTLDWSDDVAVLDWCCEMQEPSDNVGVVVKKDTILAEFAKHGFRPNVRTGSDYVADSRMISHAWLVGQALSTLQHCAIHGIIHQFAAQWKEKFVNGSATP